MTSLAASLAALALWALSWFASSIWSRRTAARPPLVDQLAYLVPTTIGGILIAAGFRLRVGGFHDLAASPPLWRLPPVAGWVLFMGCVAGLAFTWWARVTLGDLWSGTVQRKEGHQIVESGPYRLVRHPIYTGLIVALAAIVLQLGEIAGIAGIALVTFGFFLKARLEERFLADQLGADAYADYRRRTPMLTPFWPVRR